MANVANKPTAVVSEIPGRFSPLLVVDKRTPSGITTSTPTSCQLAYMSRAETGDSTFNTPLTEVIELGTVFRVGDVDDIADNKMTISSYDVGATNLGLITNTATPSGTVIGFNQLNTADVNIIRQYADPNGNIFYSDYMDSMVVEEYGIDLKAKGLAMESFSLLGFSSAGFRGFVQTKAYVVQAGDVTASGFTISGSLGANENIYPIPVPSGNKPAAYWVQRGSVNFLKIERWRPSTGWVIYPEVTSKGLVVLGTTWFNPTGDVFNFVPGDLVAGDVFLYTYMTYNTNVTTMSAMSAISGISYSGIPQLTIDTIDPVAIPTRLTPIDIALFQIPRGQTLSLKMTLKRDRAEGIGDTNGIYGPSDAPELAISFDVKSTDASLNGILQNQTPYGSDYGGNANNDFFDPNLATRNQLASHVPMTATLYDPRYAATAVKMVTSPQMVLNQVAKSTPTKGPVTVKYTGKDYVGNMQILAL